MLEERRGKRKRTISSNRHGQRSLMRTDTYVKIGAPKLTERQMKFRGVGSGEITTLGGTRVNVSIDECSLM